MEFEGLKIKSEKESGSVAKVQTENQSADAADYLVADTVVGDELLKKLKKFKAVAPDEVVYGIYNNSNRSLSVKLNDFLIDHGSISLKDKSYFFHMLAVMVDAGIPVVKAVSSLAKRTENQRFRRVLNTIAYNCEGGANLSDAMIRFEDVFDEAEIGIVRSGEATGRLHLMLFKLSEQLDKRHELSMKLWGAAVYPIAVLAVLVIVAVGMLVWVFPTLLNLLQQGGIANESLPWATRFLIFLQSAVVNFWWLILLVVFGIYGLFTMYKHSDYGSVNWDYRKLRLPVVGGLLRKLYVQRFIGMMGILIESGLPVMKALSIAGNSVTNKIYKLKVQEVINNVRVGGKISAGLEDSEFLFPPEVVQMINVGEESASLSSISVKIADQYQREIDNSLKRMSSIFEPAMILFVGLFVALLALAIMAPIFNLSSVIG